MIEHNTDIVVIGAGPIGIFTIFEAGMLDMKCHVIDVLPVIGGQCTALYPEKPIYDIPAYPEISGGELVEKLREQSAAFSPIYHMEQQVITISKEQNDFIVITDKGTRIKCRAVIIAGGNGALLPNKPPIDGIDQYENKSVFYSVTNKHMFKDKKVAIAGGGDSAVDWAIELAGIAKKIYMIHRRNKFRASPASVSKIYELVEQNRIELVIPYQLDNITGQRGYINQICVKSPDSNYRNIDAEFLLSFFGLRNNFDIVAEWGVEIDYHKIKVNCATMETNIPGIFAVGDCINYPGKLKLILTGFAETALACHSAYKLVYPDQELHFEYSTSKGISK